MGGVEGRGGGGKHRPTCCGHKGVRRRGRGGGGGGGGGEEKQRSTQTDRLTESRLEIRWERNPVSAGRLADCSCNCIVAPAGVTATGNLLFLLLDQPHHSSSVTASSLLITITIMSSLIPS